MAEKLAQVLRLSWLEEAIDDHHVDFVLFRFFSGLDGFAFAEIRFRRRSPAFLKDFEDDDAAIGFDESAEFVDFLSSFFCALFRRDDVDDNRSFCSSGGVRVMRTVLWQFRSG